ncbi:MAG: hypothetical protein AMJ90_03250 [candidate division Zixibacteria bacterium SM23_73_2]|nr:MAG: hypothetical protein AMJ90_03250 [candidate division Zixibacteria bacterium SM23_73_2]
MRAYQIISKKRDGEKLKKEEIDIFIDGYTKGKVPDYQMSAFLMAVFLKGMDIEETADLTFSMMRTGRVLDLSEIPLAKIDKHSTGGVGDKVSLILAPLVASCGVCVPMLSGRGLGHTGGTLDKLESIPGFKTSLSLKQFERNLKKIGVCVMGQTQDIAPADKKIYALRDVTATVESIPLITSSILSKKLAEGADGIVFDVKMGNGAFMQDQENAITLAQTLIKVGKKLKKRMVALVTDMNEPLGEAVGNSLEVIESIQALKGNFKEDLMEVTLALGSYMLILGKRVKSFGKGEEILLQAIRDGKALEKFRQMVKAQGGDERVIDNYELLPKAKFEISVKSPKSGYIKSIDTKKIGLAAVELGAGREKKDDKIDPAVGFLIKKKVGDYDKKGEVIAKVLANDKNKGEVAKDRILSSYTIVKAKSKRLSKIYHLVDNKRIKNI